MPNHTMIRAVKRSDIPIIKQIVDATLFPAHMLDAMIAPYFDDPDCADIWLTTEIDSSAVSVAFCTPEKLTDGTWNLLAIAVFPDLQGQKIGQELLAAVEAALSGHKARILIVETSGTSEFEQTRRFYEKLEYTREARIRDFYAHGDDKIVFWKNLE